MPLSERQDAIASSSSRFKVVAAGRRFGKTVMARAKFVRKAAGAVGNRRMAYLMPTYRQVRSLVWDFLVERLLDKRWVLPRDISRTDLSMTLRNGTKLLFRSADNYDTLRGEGLDFVVMDEMPYIDERAWTEVVRPMLATTQGGALFVGSPAGFDHFHGLHLRGPDDQFVNWSSWRATTLDGGWVSQEEIEEARLELDELTFRQEFEADFINFTGAVYYNWDPDQHVVRGLRGVYNKDKPLALCLDFNRAPGVAAVGQEGPMPWDKNLMGLRILSEVHIPRNSTTPRVIEEFAKQYPDQRGRILVYGDASGGAESSKSVEGSDFDLVEAALRQKYGRNYSLRVPKANPMERPRINAVNSYLLNIQGQRRLAVDAGCTRLIQDFGSVKLDDKGKIDKSNPDQTHLTDAVGYMIHYCNPILSADRAEQRKVALPLSM